MSSVNASFKFRLRTSALEGQQIERSRIEEVARQIDEIAQRLQRR